MGRQGRRHQRARRAPDSVQSGRLACLEAGDNLGEVFLPFPSADQFEKSARRSSSRNGVDHVRWSIIAHGRNAGNADRAQPEGLPPSVSDVNSVFVDVAANHDRRGRAANRRFRDAGASFEIGRNNRAHGLFPGGNAAEADLCLGCIAIAFFAHLLVVKFVSNFTLVALGLRNNLCRPGIARLRAAGFPIA